MKEINSIEYKDNYNISNLTTFKVGGNVKRIYFPNCQQDFIKLLNLIKKPLIVGNCSNIIFSSLGCDSEVISTSKMNQITIRGTHIIAECGVKGPTASQFAYNNSLSGFEFMIGFPGSIGGNVFMNAGAHGQSISDTLIKACLFDLNKKEIIYLDNKEMSFGYRNSIMQNNNYILLSAEFELKKGQQESILELMNRNTEFRKKIQPSLAIPNAGSVFKNPENDSAGRLLDKAGVKEFEVNGVKVWQKHANFIVNEKGGSSEDILELIYKMYKQVKDVYTIELEPEIRYFGKKSKREEEICKVLYKTKK